MKEARLIHMQQTTAARRRRSAPLRLLSRGGARPRRAAAVVEMAIVAPLLLALVFGIIEFGWMFAVRNAMTNAAREGARTGTLQGRDAADVEARVRDYLTGIGLDDVVTVDVTEATPEDPTVRVRVSAPRSEVSLVGFFFGYTQGTVEVDCSMRKEGM